MGLLPDIAASLRVTEPIAGHVISAYALGVVVGAPLIAALTARMPRKTAAAGPDGGVHRRPTWPACSPRPTAR